MLAERHWLSEQIQAQRTSLEAQRERSRIAALLCQQGVITFLEVLVQTRRAYLASGINLYVVLSGGSGTMGEDKNSDAFVSGNGRIEATEIDVAALSAGRIKDILAMMAIL